MAQKRMIDKKISVSEQVSNLSLLGQLLFERMIFHADDVGLLTSSSRTIKAMCIPMIDCQLRDIDMTLTDMEKQGLIKKIKFNEKEYFLLLSFSRSQILRKDRDPQTILPLGFHSSTKEEAKENWKMLDDLVMSLSSHRHAEWKGIEEKGIEEKGIEENRNEPKVKERKLEGKPIIPPQKLSEGSKSNDLDIFNNPQDKKDAETSMMYERLKSTSKHLIVLLAFFLFFKPVFAETIIIRYKISSQFVKTSSSQKLEPRLKSSTPSGNKKIQKDIGTKATALSEIPDVKEREFIAKLPHAEQVANIYKHESGYGRNDVCRALGQYNGFGMGEWEGHRPNCFTTFEAVATQVNQWIEMRKELNSAELTCLYIQGKSVPNCRTSYRFL